MLLLTSAVALADPVRIDFSGRLVFVRIGISEGDDALWTLIDQTLDLGMPFSGSLTFDEAAAPGSVGDIQTLYSFPASMWTLQTRFGEYEAEGSGPLEVSIIDTPSEPDLIGQGDEVWARAPLISISGSGAVDHLTNFDLLLRGESSGDPLRGNALSDVPWEVEVFPVRAVTWWFGGYREPGSDRVPPSRVQIIGTVDSLRRVAVPEPAAATLAALAIVALGALGFRRARS